MEKLLRIVACTLSNSLRLTLLLAGGMLAGIRIAPAQSPVQRTALHTLQDSLKLSEDTVSLIDLEKRTINLVKKNRNDPMLHLRLGLLAIRMRELGSKKHLDAAISEFEWATEIKPDWPWPWYGLALAEQIAPDRAAGMAGGLFTLLHLDRDTKAGTAYTTALKIDSTFADALLGMSNVALNRRNGAPVTSTLNSIRRATLASNDPNLFLALGRLERLGGNPDSALLAFGRAKAAGGSPALMWLEIARTIPLTMPETVRLAHLPDGDTAYFAGAAYDDPTVVSMYRSDLEPIVQDTMLKGFDTARGQARVAWLRDFWDVRDKMDMLPEGSRLEEHFRRWDYVMKNYRLPHERRMYAAGMETYKSGNTEVDDRGIIYLRHGAPDRLMVYGPGGRPNSIPSALCSAPGASTAPNPVIQTAANDIPIKQIGPKSMMVVRPANLQNYGNETWIYERPDVEMMLHFAANSNPADYRLQATVFGLAAGGGAATEGGTNPGLRRFCRFGNNAPFDWAAVAEEKIRAKGANMMATTTDSWSRSYPQPLPGRAAWFAVGSQDGQPLVHLVYAFNASAVADQGGAQIPVTLRAVFLDAKGKIVKTLDTVEVIQHPRAGSTLLALRLEVALPLTAQRVRLNAEVTPDRGALLRTDTLRLPEIDGKALALSDILIGRSPGSLSWHATPSDVAWLDPMLLTYGPTDTLQVYAEAYGVVPKDQYAVSLQFTRIQTGLSKLVGKRVPAISLGEKTSYLEDIAHIKRTVSLASLPPGDYVLDLTIEGKNGKVVKSRRITIKSR